MSPWRAGSRIPAVAVAVLLTLAPGRTSADVVDKGPAGFTLKTTVTVAAPPDRLFRALVDVGAWWSGDHTYTGDARNMSIAPLPGGCFCEKLPGGGGVEHGRVVQVKPGALLRLDGALGPLQEMGVAGSMTWQVAAAGEGSTLTMTYAVGGYAPGGLDALASLVDDVLSQQVRLLKAYAEKVR
jgi:uncharacterized protein YndB with AHSA1/START domain